MGSSELGLVGAIGVSLLVGCGSSTNAEPAEAPGIPVNPTPDWSAQRQAHIARLEGDGFRVARSLPEGGPTTLRPTRETAARLMALKALFLRTVSPPEQLPEAKLQAYMSRNDLLASLTASELEIWRTPREQVAAVHGDTIGWRLENIWALAWVLGYEADLSYLGGMVGPEQLDPIFSDFTPTFADGSLESWLTELDPRSEAEVAAREDLFYCAHNAVRSAQLGHDTVPPGFNPLGDGGTVHERRHVLTWVLSPGVPWDETDLSS